MKMAKHFMVMLSLFYYGNVLAQADSAGPFTEALTGALTGTWQGTLVARPGAEITVQLIISTEADKSTSVLINSPDHGTLKNVVATSVNITANALEVEFATLSGEFSGALVNGALRGEWRQLKQSFPLVLRPKKTLSSSMAAPAPYTADQLGANGRPTPTAILARYVKALGGEEAIRAHSSSTTRAKLVIPGSGIGAKMLMYAAAPNKISNTIKLNQNGTVTSGYDGKVGWLTHPNLGDSILEGEVLAHLIQQSELYAALNWSKNYDKLETLKLSKVDNIVCYKVRLENSYGREIFLYFAVESGLLLRTKMIAPSVVGDMPTRVDIKEYGEFDGVMMPTKISVREGPATSIVTIHDISFNDVTEDKFTPPALILDLLKKTPSEKSKPSPEDATLPEIHALDVPEEVQKQLLGRWSGEMGPLTLVLRFEHNDKGDFVSFIDSPNQEANGLPVTDLSMIDGKLSLKLAMPPAGYDGDLSGDKMVGSWSQNGASKPLTLTKK
jgi:hypothetical protein